MPDTAQITFDDWKALIGRTNAYLLGLGEPIERDDRGYSKADFHACLNAGIEPEGDLLADVGDRLIKYHRQIGADAAASVKAGLDLYGDRLDRGRAGASAVAVDGRAIVFFKYHAKFVAAVKRLPQKDRRFDRGTTGWIVSPRCLSQAADLLEAAGANVASMRTLAEHFGPCRDGDQAAEAAGASGFVVDVREDGGELVIKHEFDDGMNHVYRAAKVYFDRGTKTRRISREFRGKPVKNFGAKAKAVLDALRAKAGEVKINGSELLEAWAKDIGTEEKLELQPVESVLRDGVSLFPFQTDGVDFIESTGYMCIIGDEMGLGKTVQAIVASARTGLRTLVVCPAGLKYVWAREIEKFTDLSSYIATTDGDSGPICGIASTTRGGPSGDWKSRDFVIVNGDILIDRTVAEHAVEIGLAHAPCDIGSDVRMRRTNGGRWTSGVVHNIVCTQCKSSLEPSRPCPVCRRESGLRATLIVRNSFADGDRVSVEFVGGTVSGSVARCTKKQRVVKSVWSDTLKTAGFGILVVDESHYYKNWKAKRTKKLSEIAAHINRRIELTGTVIKSRPAELYSQLKLVAPEIAGRFVDFATQYCGGYRDRFGFHADGATNLDELHLRIKPVYLRRLKRDVLPELPPKLHSDIPVEMPTAAAARYRRAAADFIEYLKEEGKSEAAVAAKRAEHLTRITALKQLALKPKIEAAIEFIRNANKQGEKVVAFSGYNEVIEAITADFGDACVRIVGEDSAAARDAAVQAFQNNPAVTVFAGNIAAAGVGLTLTASSKVLFTDEPWTPGDKQQAEDRCHRIGQDDCVNVYTLLAVGTIDSLIHTILEEKAEVVAAVQDGTADSADTGDIVGDIVERMRPAS